MLNCKEFFDLLHGEKINFFSGVPESLLKFFNSYILDNVDQNQHIITANEGNAIALASGYYLATKKIGLVYMQNSGLGNAINPLVSLSDKEVYGIPVLLLIGWRGEPNEKDEPQHQKQGKITLALLETLDIPYEILTKDIEDTKIKLSSAITYMNKFNAPFALVVKKGTFEKYKQISVSQQNYELSREKAINLIIDNLDKQDVVVSTTGMISRELFESRTQKNQKHETDFLTVGSMGHASQIALGIAISNPKKQVFCLDGDGSVIMHMGSLGIIGSKQLKNFKHIILNNESHDSVGGQPTVGNIINFVSLAKSCNYKNSFKVLTEIELNKKMLKLKSEDGPILLEIMVNRGNRKDLGRPTKTPKENMNLFMNFLSK
jgi:phosphonopyruvate decarboxylase